MLKRVTMRRVKRPSLLLSAAPPRDFVTFRINGHGRFDILGTLKFDKETRVVVAADPILEFMLRWTSKEVAATCRKLEWKIEQVSSKD